MDLETYIRALPAGPVLDALCVVAMQWRGYKMDQICNTIRDYGVGGIYWPQTSRSWSAAGRALEYWLAPRVCSGRRWADVIQRCEHENFSSCWSALYLDDDRTAHVDAATAPHAIALAVALVGARERPDEMQAAVGALEGENDD